jgi:hypothetical protein
MTPTIAAYSRPDAHFRIAQCLGALGRRTEAISALTEAIGDAEASSRCHAAVTPAP